MKLAVKDLLLPKHLCLACLVLTTLSTLSLTTTKKPTQTILSRKPPRLTELRSKSFFFSSFFPGFIVTLLIHSYICNLKHLRPDFTPAIAAVYTVGLKHTYIQSDLINSNFFNSKSSIPQTFAPGP